MPNTKTSMSNTKTSMPNTKTLFSMFGPDFGSIPETLKNLPFAPYNKLEKLGKVADFTVSATTTTAFSGGGTDKDSSAQTSSSATANQSSSSRRKLRLQEQEKEQQFTHSLFTYQHQEVQDDSFSVVDRQQQIALKKQAMSGRGGLVAGGKLGARTGSGSSVAAAGSARSSLTSARSSLTAASAAAAASSKRSSRYAEKQARVRDPSIKVGNNWKLIEELDFSRMTRLYLEVDEPQDIAIHGKLNYYDKAFDKVTVKSETNLPHSALDRTVMTGCPSVTSDTLLKEYATKVHKDSLKLAENPPVDEDGDEIPVPTRTVMSTDTVIAALMACQKSVYSWDLTIDKKGDVLILDKRDGGALDFDYVNENAADPPLETIEKDTNINSHEALAQESTNLNELYTAHILKPDEFVDFKKPNPFVAAAKAQDPALVSFGAYRYRKWDMGDVNLVCRTTINSCMQTKTISPEPLPVTPESTHDLNETALVNTYVLNEFDHRAHGSGNSFEWRKKLDSQRGAVIATEMKNNQAKLARWTMESMLSGVDAIRIGFVSRTAVRDRKRHQILGSSILKPGDFQRQLAFNVENGWGIVKAIIDICFNLGDGKYVLLRDPNKAMLVLYQVSGAK